MKVNGTAIATIVASALTASAHAGITNGSFESGTTGWAVSDLDVPFFPIGSYAAGTADTGFFGWANSPTDGDFSLVTGWDGTGTGGGEIMIAQDIVVDGSTLEFDYRAGWDTTFGATLPREFNVIIEEAGGGAVLDSTTVLTMGISETIADTGQLAGSIDLSAFIGDTVLLKFEWTVPEDSTGPAQFDLDNVRLTGIPAPGVALLGLAGLARRRRR